MRQGHQGAATQGVSNHPPRTAQLQ
jgi:hypothetical protein